MSDDVRWALADLSRSFPPTPEELERREAQILRILNAGFVVQYALPSGQRRGG